MTWLIWLLSFLLLLLSLFLLPLLLLSLEWHGFECSGWIIVDRILLHWMILYECCRCWFRNIFVSSWILSFSILPSLLWCFTSSSLLLSILLKVCSYRYSYYYYIFRSILFSFFITFILVCPILLFYLFLWKHFFYYWYTTHSY